MGNSTPEVWSLASSDRVQAILRGEVPGIPPSVVEGMRRRVAGLPVEQPPQSGPSESTGIGDALRARFGLWAADQGCAACDAEVDSLNRLRPEQVQAGIEALTDRIVGRIDALDGPLGVVLRLSKRVAPGTIRLLIQREIRLACRVAQAVGSTGKQQVWALTEEQYRQHARTIAATPPESDPFAGPPVVHYGFHLWPRVGAGPVAPWRWHVERWNRIAETATGKLIVSVVIDSDTSPIEEVRAALSPRFEVVVSTNTEQGENPSFRLIQDRIPKGPDDVLIYCHAKGVRSHTEGQPAIRLWSELMYITVVDNKRRVIEQLGAGYKAFGSFRSFDLFTFPVAHKWHYSGTFFAVRAKYLPLTIQPQYGGVEAACGDAFAPEDCWCEFHDNSPIWAGYDLDYLYPQVVNEGFEWEVNRVGGTRCEQHHAELWWFLKQLRPTDRVLVIGSRNGGLESQIKARHPGCATLSIDIAPQPDNSQPVIVGSSADPLIQEQARRAGPFDVVFIDGDHSLMGATADWEFAQSLSPRLIAFHDIAKAIKHDFEGCEVDPLWATIKATHQTDELIVGGGWGGIGVVRFKAGQ